MGYDNMENLVSIAFAAIIGIYGLLMLLIPNKMLKPALLEKKNGKLIGRICGLVLLVIAAIWFVFLVFLI